MTPLAPHVSPPPTPPSESARITHTRLRRRLLSGEWQIDLEKRIAEHVGSVRARGWGPPDLSANPFRVLCRELATLYLTPPTVRHDDTEAAELLTAALNRAGLWAQMPRYQAGVIGCREGLLRLSANSAGQLVVRQVHPDMVLGSSSETCPGQPDALAELRLRPIGRAGEQVWTWDVLDCRDPESPAYRVHLAGNDGSVGEDVSDAVLGVPGGLTGELYPYRWSDGTPFVPYVVHHAEHPGDRLFDPFEGRELVEGSLNLAVLHSFWLHMVRDASWPQRVAVNARPAGLTSVDAEGRAVRQEVVTDPSTLLVLESVTTDGGQATWGQFQPGGDPAKLIEAIGQYASRLAQDAGISPADVHRAGGDPRSGYAIALSNDGKRTAQRRYAIQFRAVDERLMAMAAAILNRAAGADALPEAGWSVRYPEIPLSPEELRSRREHSLALIDAGLMSPIDAYLELHPGLTRQQAEADLAAIRP